jgi:saccharopine dehydrogenase-like NADP-dependent oxidoreductase
MTRKVLVLGAGMVAGPTVQELLVQGSTVTLADLDIEKVHALAKGDPRITPLALNSQDSHHLDAAIADHDLIISLLPPPLHPDVAKRCLNHRKHLVTTSYISEDMQALHTEAKNAELVFLNEIGLDPGIDHMLIMDQQMTITRNGGVILGFESHCGGFPAPEDAKLPLRYQFSWNPRGVLGALQRPASFLKNGKTITVPAEDMLRFSRPIQTKYGFFETTPNGNGESYRQKYGLTDTEDFYRGTLRYPLWAMFWTHLFQLGLMNQSDLSLTGHPKTRFEAWAMLRQQTQEELLNLIATQCGNQAALVLEGLTSLGFWQPLTRTQPSMSPFALVLDGALNHWMYREKEQDAVLMVNRFRYRTQEGSLRTSTITLYETGVANELSAMSRLVGTPAALGALLILDGRIREKGVLRPVTEELFVPVLEGLMARGLNLTTEEASPA